MALLLLCLAEGAAAAEPAGDGLGLDEILAFALDNSPALAAYKEEAAAAAFGVKAERGAFFPRVTGYADYSRRSDPVAVVPIKEFGGTPPNFSRDQYAAGIRVLIPVYQGGRLRAKLSAARLQHEIARRKIGMTRQDLLATVTNVFNQILYLGELAQAQKEALKALEKARMDAQARLRLGRTAPVDLLRMDTEVAAQKQAVISVVEERNRSLHALAQLIGWKDRTPPRIRGTLDLSSVPAPETTDAERLISQALERRPDILSGRAEVEKAEAELALAKGWHLPTLNLVGDYSRHAGSGLRYDEEVWSGGIAISVDIFTGGTISAKVAQAERRLRAERRRLEGRRLEARRQIRDALSRLSEARHRHEVARAAVKSARESYRIEQLKYETGAGSVTDALLAHARWQKALADEASARFQAVKASVDLRLALGLMDNEEKEKKAK